MAAKVQSPCNWAVLVRLTVTLVALDVIVPITVILPPLVLAVNSLTLLTVKLAARVRSPEVAEHRAWNSLAP